MRKEMSIYLDASRVAAAILVFVNHAIGLVGSTANSGLLLTLLNTIGQHGRGAVAIFFVLSGFVIKYISEQRENTFLAYFSARATRIYSVVIPVLVVVIIADKIGYSLEPVLYEGKDYFSVVPIVISLPISLAFLGEVWSNHIFVGTDEPFWSLSFEVWYYIIFAAYAFGKSWWRWPLVVGLLLLAGPKICVFFPLWIIGAFCYTLVSKEKHKEQVGLLSFIKGFLFLSIAPIIYVITKRYLPDGGNIYDQFHLDINSLTNTLYYSSFGIGFAATIIAVNSMGHYFSWIFNILKNQIRWLAGGTFTLYLLHQPLFLFFEAIFSPFDYSWRPTLVIVLSFIVCFLVAEIGERRKHLWANAGKWLINRTY